MVEERALVFARYTISSCSRMSIITPMAGSKGPNRVCYSSSYLCHGTEDSGFRSQDVSSSSRHTGEDWRSGLDHGTHDLPLGVQQTQERGDSALERGSTN